MKQIAKQINKKTKEVSALLVKVSQKVKRNIGQFINFISKIYDKHPYLFCFITALGMNFLIEMLCRHSFKQAVKLVLFHPLVFAYGVLVIALTYAISLLFRKGLAFWGCMSALWLTFGISSCVILFFRSYPLTGSDFTILSSVLPILTVYLTIFQIILISLAIIGAIVALVFAWIKIEGRDADHQKDPFICIILALVVAILTPIYIQTGVFVINYTNINEAYRDNGYVYSFMRSVFLQKMRESDNYTEQKINDIMRMIENEQKDADEPEIMPNIIYIQLESFMDPTLFEGFTFSENPIPFITELKESYPHGYLSVQDVGGGTANTEYEILTGMNLDHFAIGFFPYLGVLNTKKVESVPYLLGEMGYTSHAIHNNTATFYHRNTAYPNLSFDTFTSIEYMYDVPTVGTSHWRSDEIYTTQLMDTLLSTDGLDFIFAVSVQPHGPYPEVQTGEYTVTVTNTTDEADYHKLSYYATQVNAVDGYLRQITEQLNNFDEPTVLVMYGDHMPILGRDYEDMLQQCSAYQTEYVIWSNFDIVESGWHDLETYQLSAKVFQLIGYEKGILFGLHTHFSRHRNYDKFLELLEYDMVHGKKYCYGGISPFKEKSFTFGILPIVLVSVDLRDDRLVVYGVNFNEYSYIFINGNMQSDTVFDKESGSLTIENVGRLKSGDVINVGQVSSGVDAISINYTELSYTNEIIIE